MIKSPLPLLLLILALLPAGADCGWEKIRSSDAPLAVVSASTGAYDLSYTVGDNCASAGLLVSAPSSLWSGYLSLVPADVVSPGLAALASTSSVLSDGGLWGMTQGEKLDLVFGGEIAEELSDHGVKVTQVYDNAGNAVNLPGRSR